EIHRICDGVTVSGISPSLEPISRVRHVACQLAENQNRAFLGSKVTGIDFFELSQEEAELIVMRDPKSREVVSPFVGGKELNSSIDMSPERWVLNFGDMVKEEAARYDICFQLLSTRIEAAKGPAALKGNWWRYE